ncbi:MAG: hypothetical protein ABSC19_14200 [Syntrophorhabdales bacterium]|jgi:hypothetical protein
MKEPAETLRIEPRWPVALAILTVILLLVALRERVRVFPMWFPYVAGAVVLAPMAAVTLTTARARWLRVEGTITILFIVATEAVTLANMGNLIGAMVHRAGEISGLQLLGSSVAAWATNVLVFSLLYWKIDRGGPESRVNNKGMRPDWLFPQTGAGEDVPSGWRPTFVDYLFLGFSTATAFSPTDAMPLTSRAKMLMMLEGAISLVTIVVVASRAINILGS